MLCIQAYIYVYATRTYTTCGERVTNINKPFDVIYPANMYNKYVQTPMKPCELAPAVCSPLSSCFVKATQRLITVSVMVVGDGGVRESHFLSHQL